MNEIVIKEITHYIEHKVSKENIEGDGDSVRADQLVSKVTNLSRKISADLIESKHVTIGGQSVKKSAKIKLGTTLKIGIPKLTQTQYDLTPKNIEFGVIYENDNYAIIDKPAGLVVHHGAGEYSDTLVNGLLYRFNIERQQSNAKNDSEVNANKEVDETEEVSATDDNIDDYEDIRPGIVHRLDKETSGLMIIAKTLDAKLKFTKMFADKSNSASINNTNNIDDTNKLEKYYVFIASGTPKLQTFTVEEPIGRHNVNRLKMTIDYKNGKYAKTKFTVLHQYDKYFYGQAQIFTGRTHQIRVHLAHLNYHIYGDKLYGASVANKAERQLLHAYKLTFLDPFQAQLTHTTTNTNISETKSTFVKTDLNTKNIKHNDNTKANATSLDSNIHDSHVMSFTAPIPADFLPFLPHLKS